jgi:beta-xylosidase
MRRSSGAPVGAARLSLPLLAASLVALAACAGGGGSTAGPDASASDPGGSAGSALASAPVDAIPGSGAPGASAPTSPAASDPPDAGVFTNPVLDVSFADPYVLEVDGTYYGYATGDLSVNIQVARSEDLVTWERLGEALPKLPFWQPSAKGLTWAPEVLETDAGFVMYYTGRDVQAGKQCLAVAVADRPEGPFVDKSTEPFLCQRDLGGSIDATTFRDGDDSLYLIWKNDGNCCGIHTRFYLQKLSADGLELEGKATDLGLDNDEPWERHVIEAPTLIRHDDRYVMFYSANAYDSTAYAVGYATSDALTGPYLDADENPILASAGAAAGPGHQSIVADDDGDLWMVYHAWHPERIGDNVGGRRTMWIDELTWEDGRPVVDGPEDEPQPVP